MWALTLLGPNLYHLHQDYMKICIDLHQLDISHQQDIIKNAIVYRLGGGGLTPDYFTIKVCSVGKSDRHRDVTQGNPLLPF